MTRNTLHDRLYSLATLVVLAGIAFAGVGCSSTPTGVAGVAGRYELRSVDGRSLPDERLGGAIGGEMLLSADGYARRVVRYATSGIPGPIVNRATGGYRMRGSQITLTLTEQGRTARLGRWQVSGEVQPPVLVLRYFGPAERMVEERYVRVP
jgi:hypothetical protein